MRPLSVCRSAVLLGGIMLPVGTALLAETTPQGPARSSAPGAGPLIFSSQSAQLSNSAPHSSTAPTPGVSQGAVRHCSVVGAVRYPATYAAKESSVLLRSLIDQAGGLTEHAAGTVRILHAGRQQQLRYSPALPSVSIPPDAVVVIDAAGPGPHAKAGEARQYTDVACMDLLDRPVVLWLEPENATIPKVLQLLGQSPHGAALLHAIRPSVPGTAPHESLDSGTVLVFNPQSIDRHALETVLQRWPLPDVVELQETPRGITRESDVVDVLRFLQRGMTSEPQAVLPDPTQAANVAASSLVVPSPAESQSGEIAQAGAPLPAPPRREPRAASREVPAPLPVPAVAMPEQSSAAGGSKPPRFQRDRAVAPASALQLQSDHPPSPVPVLDPIARPARAARHAAPLRESAAPTLPAASDATPARASRTQPRIERALPVQPDATPARASRTADLARAAAFVGLIVSACLAILVGWTRWRRNQRRHEAALAALRLQVARATGPRVPEAASPTSLDQLINNTLSVREEETVFADAMTFHGRTVGFRYMIRNGPHQLQGPHFSTVQSRGRTQTPFAAAAAPAGTRGRTAEVRTPLDAARRGDDSAELPPQQPSHAAGDQAARGVSPLERALRNLLRNGRENA